MSTQQIENAVPSVTGNGVSLKGSSNTHSPSCTPLPGRSTMSLYGKDDHKRVSKMLGYALTLGDERAWTDASVVFQARLTPTECGRAAAAFLLALDEDQAGEVAGMFLHGAGMPQSPLFSPMDQASHWADMASTGERKAHCLASYNRLSPQDQAAFLQHVKNGAAT
ncbi:hypothetical protein [Pseudohalocynthiibacter sp. F2068]|jgi:hypothetical protein|uniref:hypothetical protein n=1 Tax=Pseudohalocynthiibacter sp. F2068 TaxID=2926418 RepID=UPI001FF6FB8B|nr:hypothetical protein [Pseudohalocynthiibacter sp. F2068]MCK0102535.1 hypothetical protein [Pseudohalocynthiibacter sp. F2068]